MSNIFTEQKPFIRILTNDKFDINEYDITFSNDIHYPELSLGFNHFNHKTVNKYFDAIDKFKNKNKVYLITQDFEPNIVFDEMNESQKVSINSGATEYIKTIDNNFPDIIASGFYKFFEINAYFNLITKSKSLNVVNLSNSDCSMFQCLSFIRMQNTDKYYSFNDNQNILKNYLGKQIEITEKFKSNSADLIICDTEFIVSNEHIQEQQMYEILLNNINDIIDIQKKDGSLILKINETYTSTTIKLIEFIKQFYETSYICKPLTCDAVSSEKYLICLNFNKTKKLIASEKEYTKIVNKLKNNEFNIYDIMTDCIIPDNTINFYTNLNIDLGILQYRSINKLLIYVDNNNYNGSEYNTYYNKQITSAIYYNNIFFNDNYEKIHKKLNEIIVFQVE